MQDKLNKYVNLYINSQHKSVNTFVCKCKSKKWQFSINEKEQKIFLCCANDLAKVVLSLNGLIQEKIKKYRFFKFKHINCNSENKIYDVYICIVYESEQKNRKEVLIVSCCKFCDGIFPVLYCDSL